MNDTQPATKPRQERHTDHARRRYTDPAGQRGFLAGLSLLAQARVHQLRRARRSNRDHAQRTRRAPALDQRTALSACPQLLHGAARPGGAAACDLHRLAHAPHGGRHRRRRPLRAALAVHPHCLVVDLYRLWACAGRGGFVLRHQARGHRHRRAGRAPHRLARAQEQSRVGRRRRGLRGVVIALLLWLLPMAVLMSVYGWHGTLTQMAWFFTKAALLTFGGAYAVLPYVYQGAVEHYGWLTPTQMIDGLALGETTPGPLIMVVAFAGFVGGYVKAPFGPDALFLGGAVAAAVVTWFTFLPSFAFILAGGPLVESTHGALTFTAPRTAITAAVVGVILNLALFFGYHVLWPRGIDGGFDWISALIALSAAIALFRYKRNVIQVIAACGMIGLLLTLFR